MKIFYQTNNNDCGIAITQSLIKHFCKKSISKEELYRESNLKEDGLSILDLEMLNAKYGIHLESYSMSFDEFVQYQTKDYFVLVINRAGEQHYTIAKKSSKKKVTLFDPSLGKTTVSLDELKEMWMDLFILVSKKDVLSKDSKVSIVPILRDKLDVFQVSLLFFVNVFTLAFSILNTYLIKYSFNHVYNHHNFINFVKVIFISLIFFGIFYFGEFLES